MLHPLIPPSPEHLPTTGFTFLLFSTVFPFPESHIVGITQDLIFSNWLLLLRNVHLRVLSFHSLTAHLGILYELINIFYNWVMVMAAQFGEYAKHHWNIDFKRVAFMNYISIKRKIVEVQKILIRMAKIQDYQYQYCWGCVATQTLTCWQELKMTVLFLVASNSSKSYTQNYQRTQQFHS